MSSIPITSLTLGTPKSTDVLVAVDITDITQAPTGTTKKYNWSDELNYIFNRMGFVTLSPCVLATTGALNATYANGASGVNATLTNAGSMTALTIDGVVVVAGNRILVKNQASALQNGIYTVTIVGTGATNWVLTRATDFDTTAEILDNLLVQVSLGTTNNNILYQSDVTVPVTVGTDAINFSLFTMTTAIIPLPISLANGGTSKSLTAINGAVVWCDANSFELSAVGAAGQVLQSNGAAAPTWSAPTYPSASGSAGKLLQSDGTNNIYSVSTYPVASLTSGKILISDGTNIIGSTPTYPNAATSTGSFIYANGINFVASTSLWPNTVGTSGKIVISDGTSNVYSTPTYPNTSATARKILVSDGTNIVYSTETWATPGTSGNQLTSDGTNWISAPAGAGTLTTNHILVGSAGGIATDVAMSGDATIVASGALTIANSAVTNAKMANMNDQTIKGNVSGGAAAPVDLTKAQVLTMLSNPLNQVTGQQFTTNGTYTPTSGMKFCIIECIGAGGGGGGFLLQVSGTNGSGGGGAGGYLKALLTAAQIGASQTITVSSSGGAGGTAGLNNGNPGGNTTVGSLLTANGGSGGTASQGTTSVGVPIAGGAGGTATVSTGTALVTYTGQPGTQGLGTGAINAARSGQGGSTTYGQGGAATMVDQAGVNAIGFGGGGSGAAGNTANNRAGGNGSPGLVIITEFISI